MTRKSKKELSSLEKKFIDLHIANLLTKQGRVDEQDLLTIASEMERPAEFVKAYFEHTSPQVETVSQPVQSKKELTLQQQTLRKLMNQPTAGGKGTVTIASEASAGIIEDSIRQGNSTGINRNERNIFRGNK